MAAITMTPTTTGDSRGVNWGRFALVGLGTIVAAVLANVVVYFIGGLFVAYDPQFLPLANVSGTIVFTMTPAILALPIYALLLRFARKPARTFRIIAAVVFVITLIPDFTYIPTVPGATAGQMALLPLMHAVAAGVIVWMLTTRARKDDR